MLLQNCKCLTWVPAAVRLVSICYTHLPLPAMSEDHSPRETIGGARGGGGALFSTTKLGTDVGITPKNNTCTHRCMHAQSTQFSSMSRNKSSYTKTSDVRLVGYYGSAHFNGS